VPVVIGVAVFTAGLGVEGFWIFVFVGLETRLKFSIFFGLSVLLSDMIDSKINRFVGHHFVPFFDHPVCSDFLNHLHHFRVALYTPGESP